MFSDTLLLGFVSVVQIWYKGVKEFCLNILIELRFFLLRDSRTDWFFLKLVVFFIGIVLFFYDSEISISRMLCCRILFFREETGICCRSNELWCAGAVKWAFLWAVNGRLASNTLPLINVCGSVFVGVAVCGFNTLPLLIVCGAV